MKLDTKSVTEVFVIPIKTRNKCIKISQKLRNSGIKADMDIMSRSISKNLKYADSYNIPYVIFVGERELQRGKVKLRDMKSGKEEMLTLDSVIKKLK
jgi:histidyl-tRNA synthetase